VDYAGSTAWVAFSGDAGGFVYWGDRALRMLGPTIEFDGASAGDACDNTRYLCGDDHAFDYDAGDYRRACDCLSYDHLVAMMVWEKAFEKTPGMRVYKQTRRYHMEGRWERRFFEYRELGQQWRASATNTFRSRRVRRLRCWCAHNGRVYIAWKGDGNDNLNVAQLCG
jgi:hypothetical protein